MHLLTTFVYFQIDAGRFKLVVAISGIYLTLIIDTEWLNVLKLSLTKEKGRV